MGTTISTTSSGSQLVVAKPRPAGLRKVARRRHSGKGAAAPLSRIMRSLRGSDGEESDDGMELDPTPGEGGKGALVRGPPPAGRAFGQRLMASRRPEIYVELSPDLMLYVLGYLDVRERHRCAAGAVCRQLRDRVSENREVWAHLCAAAPWRVARTALEGHAVAELRALHRAVLRAARDAEGADVARVSEIMAAHPDVAGVQRKCLEALADRLHCETARKAALEAGVTARVVECLWKFAGDAELRVVALHCVVFLARPIGGAEGMVYHRGMASQGLDAFLGPRGGVAAVLEAMRGHAGDARVQAMGCWSLVNLALNHRQKLELLLRDGLDRVLEAMDRHPGALEVQFRALFALINLVIPEAGAREPGGDLREAHRRVVKHVLSAMGAFPESEKLVRCGCLVLHNLSLDDVNVPHLLAAGVARPLQRAASSHRDADVQRSAVSTLRRLRVAVPSELPPPPPGAAEEPEQLEMR